MEKYKSIAQVKLLLFLTLIFSLSSCDQATDNFEIKEPRLNKNDSLAIVSFYNSMKGDNWRALKWDLSNIETWGGVTLSLDKKTNQYFVTEISLQQGIIPEGAQLPADIGNLKYLRVFLIDGGTSLGGEIPKSLFSCPLVRLAIVGKQIKGKLPTEIKNIGKTVEQVCIGGTSLDGELPVEELLACKKLKYPLDLSFNEFTGNISVKLLELNTTIILTNNNFTSLDWAFFDNNNTNIPHCSHNKLTGIVPTHVLETTAWKNYRAGLMLQKKGYGFTF